MKTVLLIEDNTDIRENMSEILELSGYKVVSAADGKQGVAAAIESKPDIIVCDIMMPELDGYGVIHMLQKNKDTQNIPFIFLTAKAERAEIRKGMELGADDYITKPFNGTELLNAIESRLRKNEILRKEIQPGLEGLNTIINYGGGKDIMEALAEEGNITTIKKRQIVYSEGNHALRLFYLKSGKVKSYKTNDDGKELITAIYNEGDFFGYVALLEQTLYKETTEALEECEIAVIPKTLFEELINHNTDLLKKFIGLLAKNVAEKEDLLLGLAYNSLRKKVANSLLTVLSKYNTNQEKTSTIHISRENLATIAGTAYESLIRTLKDFKEEKLIELNKGDIIILNEKKLANLAN
jgi:CRP/FNR family transcriptional regulator, cyclic AMP receptor protein